MTHKFFSDERPHKGLTYNDFINESKSNLDAADPEMLGESDKKLLEYTKLNLHRSSRVEKTYKVDPALIAELMKIDKPQLWMVITEDWCGDSAQNLPYIAKMAECNPLINLRIIQRDDNLDIMDLYLTNGKSRSIPKLVAFDENGNEIFQWGPRPKEAQEFVDKSKAEGLSKDQFIEKLHLWYGRDRGKNLESEFIKIFHAAQ